MFNFLPGAFLQFEYSNHRAKTEVRHVEFRGMQVGQNDYYREPTILMHCYDFDREAPRSFSFVNINAGTIAPWEPTLEQRGQTSESNSLRHARRELDIVYRDAKPEDRMGYDEVIELVRLFASQGHSGFSASWTTTTLERLLRFEPLTPLTGDDDEWNEVGEEDGIPSFQNNRCSHVFKNGKDGHAYDINGRVFQEESGSCFTGNGSRKWITFPYTPVIEYVKVNAEGQPIEGPSREELAALPPE